MTDDTGRGRPGRGPVGGNVGPADPTADPVTDPGVRLPVPMEAPTAPVPLSGSAPSGSASAAPLARAARRTLVSTFDAMETRVTSPPPDAVTSWSAIPTP